MQTAELLKKVRKIEIKTRGLTNQIFAGEYHSAFKGRGMTFSEVREYDYGDDIRSIDWNVTARANHPYVKVFSEERELTLMLLVDISPSQFTGLNGNQSKNEFITELCAVLAFAAINNNDKVGLLLFSDKIELFIPPKKGKTHILRIIRELLQFQATGKGTDIEMALKYFNNLIKKRSIAFLISDFTTDKNYQTVLSIASRTHDLIGIKVNDQSEKSLPNVGLIRVYDPETGRIAWMDTSHSNTRISYQNFYLKCEQAFNEQFKKAGSDIIKLDTKVGYVKELMKFFKKRESKR